MAEEVLPAMKSKGKTYYGMYAEEIAARAPFEVYYYETVRWDWDSPHARRGWPEATLVRGYIVRDKNGDKAFPPIDFSTEQLCRDAAEELNLVAAKWLMEHDGPPAVDDDFDEAARRRIYDELNHYYEEITRRK
jgi:hypothetical protein